MRLVGDGWLTNADSGGSGTRSLGPAEPPILEQKCPDF
jgi:hypothetical protein